MTRALLIRHGETPWNRDRRWQGHADVPLSPDGLEQAVRLAAHLREQSSAIEIVYSSDLLRARDTARELARVLGVPLALEPSWREMHVGAWTGLNRDEIKARFAEEWERIAAGEDLRRGGGETFAEFSARVLRSLDSIRARHADQTVAVVTHGGVIRAALLHALGLPAQRLREVSRVDNTAVKELCWTGGAWAVSARNDVPHPEIPV